MSVCSVFVSSHIGRQVCMWLISQAHIPAGEPIYMQHTCVHVDVLACGQTGLVKGWLAADYRCVRRLP